MAPYVDIKTRMLNSFAVGGPRGDCYEWTGGLFSNGYGCTSIRGKSLSVHRLSYSFWVGDLDKKDVVCHTCDNKKCFRPAHLFKGTHRDNVLDMVKKGRHASQKLTTEQYIAIRSDERTLKEIAKDYGVSGVHICRIKSGKKCSTFG